jgi:hypothetical protein
LVWTHLVSRLGAGGKRHDSAEEGSHLRKFLKNPKVVTPRAKMEPFDGPEQALEASGIRIHIAVTAFTPHMSDYTTCWPVFMAGLMIGFFAAVMLKALLG